ncbi:hypothetical protein AC579_3277 [Pseudocercospora musae]|uniref:Uncharacterized protein n=1 Tax=Pseudocercospora musae TaxID=113226 RepID=A0A139ID88_9PEZI|nr:hypothetical protein AC579_3277 [Pseudocercospora musae]KXT12680.1 hypothetical protein AC579_3277 [Pseudocercospora musae]
MASVNKHTSLLAWRCCVGSGSGSGLGFGRSHDFTFSLHFLFEDIYDSLAVIQQSTHKLTYVAVLLVAVWSG